MNPNIPEKCNGCGKPLLIENLYVEDGCPCNSMKGINFKPKPCRRCGEACSRPGHRLVELFGEINPGRLASDIMPSVIHVGPWDYELVRRKST